MEGAPQVNILCGFRMSPPPPCTHPPQCYAHSLLMGSRYSCPCVSALLATGLKQACQGTNTLPPQSSLPSGMRKGNYALYRFLVENFFMITRLDLKGSLSKVPFHQKSCLCPFFPLQIYICSLQQIIYSPGSKLK